jgi:hypothetical protein
MNTSVSFLSRSFSRCSFFLTPISLTKASNFFDGCLTVMSIRVYAIIVLFPTKVVIHTFSSKQFYHYLCVPFYSSAKKPNRPWLPPNSARRQDQKCGYSVLWLCYRPPTGSDSRENGPGHVLRQTNSPFPAFQSLTWYIGWGSCSKRSIGFPDKRAPGGGAVPRSGWRRLFDERYGPKDRIRRSSPSKPLHPKSARPESSRSVSTAPAKKDLVVPRDLIIFA